MKNQNRNNQYYSERSRGYSEPEDYGRRYRKDEPSYSGRFDDDFDVDEYASHRRYPQERDSYRQNRSQSRRQYADEYYDRSDRYDDRYEDRYDDRYDRRRRDDYYDDRYDSRSYQKPKKSSGGGTTAVIVIGVIVLLVGLGIVGFKLYEYYSANKNHNALQALSYDFDELYARNNDFFGWMKIEDTEIDYPVMYTPDEPERYLHMNFDGDYSESGELFMDADCDPNGYHYLIYGHHMNNGTMFGSLPDYAEEDYFNAHSRIRFDTRSELGEYEIFAVFYSKVYDDDDDVFKYYQCANLNYEGDYYNYVENVKAMSIYDTGVTPEYGEKILTLSTCNYHTDDGRFVVCARKVA